LRDWLGLPNEEEGSEKSIGEGPKESRPISADEEEVKDDVASDDEEVEDDVVPEMEGSGLTPKQRARAKEKEKRKEAGESAQPEEQAVSKLPKGYILVPHKEGSVQNDSELTRHCLDQMFDDDDSDTGDPLNVEIKKEASETHSIGCVQIDQDVLREINSLENVKVEPVQNDDIMPSQPSSSNPSDDSIPNDHNLNDSPLPDPSQRSKNLEKLCILDTRPHVLDSEEAEKNKLRPLEVKLTNMASSKADLSSGDEKVEFKNESVANSSSGRSGKNKVVDEEETNLDHSPIVDKSEEEDEDDNRSFWAQYFCTTCQWLLGGAEGLLQHNREQRGRHHNVKPLWSFNQQEVRVQDLKKSRKFGVMVRELELEYLQKVKEEEECFSKGLKEKLKKEVLKNGELQKEGLKNESLRLEGLRKDLEKNEEREEEDIKLKIGKASNGRFSVIN